MRALDLASSTGSQIAHGASVAGSQLSRAPGIARSTGAHLAMLSPPRRRVTWSEGFYDLPDGLERLAPGELLRSEPMHAYLVPGVRLRARAWRLLYRSTGAVGEPTAVSGTLLLPSGIRRRQPLPLIGYAMGTHGIADRAASSRLLSTGLDWEAGLLALVLARGFAVVVTDYQGLGTPGDHAFMVGRALGNNVLDAIRAARHVAGAEPEAQALGHDGPLAIMGYSEGGAAAAWAGQLQPIYAPELELSGLVAGAAAADVELAAQLLDGTRFVFLVAYAAIGFAAAYPDLELDPYLDATGRALVARLRQSTALQAAVRGPRHARIDRLSDPNVIELPQWRARMRENRLGTLAPATPVLLHHVRGDQIVAFEQSEQLFEDWSALGVSTTLHVTRAGFDHVSGAVMGTPIALDWLSGRFEAGPPAGGRKPSSLPRRSDPSVG